MSYTITCYCNDETIKTTSVYIASAGITRTGTYGSSSLGDYEEFSVSGLIDSWSAKFTATPAPGCSFYRWVYRIGSTSATLQHSYSNPFTYTGGKNIYIRAEGTQDEVEDSPWHAWQMSLLEISTYEQSVDIENEATGSYMLEPYNVYRYTVVFAYSGYAHFYTRSSIDTIGYLSDQPFWNDEGTGPAYEIASDDNSGEGSNFDIKYYVTAGTEYQVYVRGYSGEESGYVTLYVTEPWELNSSNLGTLSAARSTSISISPCTLYCRQVSFLKSGTVTISTTGSVDTIAWLSTTDDWDRGMPTNYVASDDDSGEGKNFLITYGVEAGQTYYIWFRGYDAASGATTLNISTVETITRPNDFSWTYSKVQGGTFNLTATEWNNLAKRINEFRAYKGLSNYSFTTAYSGNNYMAYMYNQARTAIQGISGYGAYIPSVSSGDTVTAYMMNVLVSELNSIP